MGNRVALAFACLAATVSAAPPLTGDAFLLADVTALLSKLSTIARGTGCTARFRQQQALVSRTGQSLNPATRHELIKIHHWCTSVNGLFHQALGRCYQYARFYDLLKKTGDGFNRVGDEAVAAAVLNQVVTAGGNRPELLNVNSVVTAALDSVVGSRLGSSIVDPSIQFPSRKSLPSTLKASPGLLRMKAKNTDEGKIFELPLQLVLAPRQRIPASIRANLGQVDSKNSPQ